MSFKPSVASRINTFNNTPSQLVNSVQSNCKASRSLYTHSNQIVNNGEEALDILRKGNERFVKGNVLASNRSLERVKSLSAAQKPFASILACADSRVPVELIFDQGFGDLFVNRVAGNIVTTELCASLEFGSLVLGSKLIFVLGHTSCGAVNATLSASSVPGVISSLYYHMHSAVSSVPANTGNRSRSDVAVEENVKFQMSQLKVSPVLSGLVKEGKLKIVGGVYHLETGKVVEIS